MSLDVSRLPVFDKKVKCWNFEYDGYRLAGSYFIYEM